MSDADDPARARPERPADHDRHAARRRARRVRQRDGLDAVAGPAVGRRRAAFRGPSRKRSSRCRRTPTSCRAGIRSRTACARTPGFRFPGDVDTLATLLKARGYRTGRLRQRVSARCPLRPRARLRRLRRPLRQGRRARARSASRSALGPRPSPRPSRGSRRSPQPTSPPTPWFAWVHLYEPHFPYAPPEPFATRYRAAPYLGEVSAADAALAPLVAPILEQGGDARTLVVVTGDHGESLGEHGEQTHGLFAYEATLRVPLIVYQPRLFASARRRRSGAARRHPADDPRRDRPCAAAGARRRSLLAAHARRRRACRRAVVFRGAVGVAQPGLGAAVRRRARTAEVHRSADPRALRRRAPIRPRRGTSRRRGRRTCGSCRRLLEQLRAADRGHRQGAESAETRERLRSLGYLTGTAAPKTSYTEADDPKRLIGARPRRSTKWSRGISGGDLRRRDRARRGDRRQRPDMALSLTHLAFLYSEAGDHATRGAHGHAARSS